MDLTLEDWQLLADAQRLITTSQTEDARTP